MLNLRFFMYIPFVFFFLPAFMVYISETTFLPVSVIVNSICITIFCLINPKKLFLQIKILYLYTPFKYLVYLYIWICISGILCLSLHYITIFKFLWAIIIGVSLRLVFIYIYSSVVVPQAMMLKTVIKLFIIAYLIIFFLGLLEFFGAYFDISVINTLIHFLSNIRSEDVSVIVEASTKLPRIRSVCMEPGTYGRFIAINMPIIYQLTLSKYKIFSLTILNKIIKVILIPTTWISLILTQSPIYLIICLIITGLFFYKKILNLVTTKFIIVIFAISILSVVIIFYLMLSNFSFEGTFLNRIVKVLGLIQSFSIYNLIQVEASLATRVINNINQFLLFLKHPLTGIGLFNNGTMLINQFEVSPVPLTYEMISILSKATNVMSVTSNALYGLLYQTGLFGALLYILFMIKFIKFTKVMKKYFFGIEKDFVAGLYKSIIVIFAISILYNQDFNDQYLFFMIGLCSALYYYLKKKQKGVNIKQNDN